MFHYPLLLYIDPGTGAMLFTALIGLVTTASFLVRKISIKIKFLVSGGKISERSSASKHDIVIFSDHKRYWNVFKPICDELERRQIRSSFWTASPDDPALKEKYEYVECSFIGEGNKAFARLNMMNAHICLATTPGLDVYQWKRSKNVDFYAHIYHSVGGSTLYRMFGMDFYDAVLISGDFQEEPLRKMESMRGLSPKDVLTVGSVYLDALADKAAAFISSSEKDPDNITVLLAPSWGKSAILSKYGEEFLKQLKKTGYNIIVRPHPQSKTSEKEMLEKLERDFPESISWHWNYDNDNFEVLSRSDILISDFSSVIFDYSLVFNGPVIYTDTSEIDTAPYDAAWFNEPLWIDSALPLLGCQLARENIEDIKGLIDDTISNTQYSEGREKVKQAVWMHQHEAACRTVEYLLGKLTELTTVSGKDQ